MLLWLKWKQFSIQTEMEHQIQNKFNYFVSIEISKDYFIKNEMDDGREIEIGGKYFDIKSIEYKDNRVVLHGLFDDEETSLVSFISHYFQKKSSKHNQPPSLASVLIVLAYLPPVNDYIFKTYLKANEPIFIENLFCIKVHSKVSTPPPQPIS